MAKMPAVLEDDELRPNASTFLVDSTISCVPGANASCAAIGDIVVLAVKPPHTRSGPRLDVPAASQRSSRSGIRRHWTYLLPSQNVA
jgi:hypothetical protein